MIQKRFWSWAEHTYEWVYIKSSFETCWQVVVSTLPPLTPQHRDLNPANSAYPKQKETVFQIISVSSLLKMPKQQYFTNLTAERLFHGKLRPSNCSSDISWSGENVYESYWGQAGSNQRPAGTPAKLITDWPWPPAITKTLNETLKCANSHTQSGGMPVRRPYTICARGCIFRCSRVMIYEYENLTTEIWHFQSVIR